MSAMKSEHETMDEHLPVLKCHVIELFDHAFPLKLLNQWLTESTFLLTSPLFTSNVYTVKISQILIQTYEKDKNNNLFHWQSV